MNSLFEQDKAHLVIQRLRNLEFNKQPLWGKMNAAQMTAHLAAGLEIYFGERHIRPTFFSKLVGPLAKKKLFTDKPWPKNLPTAKELIISSPSEFEKEREKVIQLVQRVMAGGKKETNPVHGFFGKMSSDEWGRFLYKHIDHHLTQFGV